jgi:hypothetical protein
MNIYGKIKKLVNHPNLLLEKLVRHTFLINLPDELYLRIIFRLRVGYPLKLNNPKSFNEKLQWLKLYDRNPEYTKIVDKYEVRSHIADNIGEEYLIPLLGVWDKFEDINFQQLPQQFVLKCTHDSGGIIICKDKSVFDIDKAREKMDRYFARKFYKFGREYPYKDIKPRIIVEKYIEDVESDDLKDYKFMCFNGKVRCSFVCSGRNSAEGLHVTFFDNNWQQLPFERHYPASRMPIKKPEKLDEMMTLSEKLAKGIRFVRVDLYEVSGKVYFGEMTLFPGSGMEEFTPVKWDYELGSWLNL